MKRETILARDVRVGDVLEKYGMVDMVENEGDIVQIGYAERGGNWGDFPADEKLVRLS